MFFEVKNFKQTNQNSFLKADAENPADVVLVEVADREAVDVVPEVAGVADADMSVVREPEEVAEIDGEVGPDAEQVLS